MCALPRHLRRRAGGGDGRGLILRRSLLDCRRGAFSPGGRGVARRRSRGRRTGGGGARAAVAYLWDASVPVEMDEIDGMDKLDAALATSAESNQPVIIDWMASWCRKCIYLKPKLEKIVGEYPGLV